MYCTVQDMIDDFGEAELIQLTDYAGLDVINSALIEKTISDASAKIDGYLFNYVLPLSAVPPDFSKKCRDLARYFLYKNAVPEHIMKEKDAIEAYFSKVADDKVLLAADRIGSTSHIGLISAASTGGIFGRAYR